MINRGKISVKLSKIEQELFTFFIRLPIFVDRQLQAFFPTTECYKNMPDDYSQIPEDVSMILAKIENEEISEEFVDTLEGVYNSYMTSLYALKNAEKEKLITNEEFIRAREILRGQLPTCGFTEITASLTPDEYYNFQESCKTSSKEIQEVARLMSEAVITGL